MSQPLFDKRRAFGQHFLRDENVIARIVERAFELATDCEARGEKLDLLEIGPGQGALTEPLMAGLGPTRTLALAERDRQLIEYWRLRAPKITIHEGDFLELSDAAWMPVAPRKLGVVSNLPYSAGTAIVGRLAQHPDKIPFMVLMFQAEVAHRLRAVHGEKHWGSLSIWLQNRWDVTKVIAVPPRAFQPAPKVDSEVVELVPRAEPRVAVGRDPRSEELWNQLLKTSFAQRRKMLRAGLPKNSPFSEALKRSGIDETLRAEALSWDQWSQFYAAYSEIKGS